MKNDEMLEYEKQDLATHVEMCRRRYENLESKLTRIEKVQYAILLILAIKLFGLNPQMLSIISEANAWAF